MSIGTMGTSGLPRQLDKMVDQIVGPQTCQLDIYLDKFGSQISHFIQSGGRDSQPEEFQKMHED